MDWSTTVGLIGFGCGAAAGFLIALAALPHRRRARRLQEELDQARSEHTEYRGQVNQHFQKTADLFEQMTDRYRAIYQHLAAGAQTLCEEQPRALDLDLSTQQRLEDDKTVADPSTDEPVRSKEQPGADIDETLLGDAPHVPKLDEVVESEPQPPAAEPKPSLS